MTRSIFILFLLSLSTSLVFSQPQWLKNYGTINGEIYSAMDVDADGNIYVTGTFNDSLRYGELTVTGKNYSAFIAKFNSEGEIEWLKSEASDARYTVYDLAIMHDGGFVIGGTFDTEDASFGDIFLPVSITGNTFLAKYDKNGNIQWAKTETGGGYYEYLSVDKDNNIIVTGSIYSDFNFDGNIISSFGDYDIFYAKYNSSGDPQWIKNLGSEGSEAMSEITTDDENNIIITGRFNTSFVYEGFNFNVTALGDIFIMKTDDLGDPIWLNLIASDDDDSDIEGLGIGSDGNIYIGASVNNNTHVDAFTINTLGLSDACLMQLNPENGAVNWYKTGGSYEYDYVYCLTIGADGVFIGGIYNSAAEFDGLQLPDTYSGSYITAYDYDGNAVKVTAFTGESFVSMQDMASDLHGNIYCSGYFDQDVVVDGLDPITTNGSSDLFMYKESSDLVDIQNENNYSLFTLSPNPAVEIINILNSTDELLNGVIINQLGEKVQSFQSTIGETPIKIDQLPSGLYYVSIVNDKGETSSKSFIKN